MHALRFMTDDERARLLERAETVTFPAGTTIMREGHPYESIYIIQSGTVQVSSDGVIVDKVGPGESVGEMSFLDVSITSAEVTAAEDVTALALHLANIADLLEEDGELARNLYHSLAVLLAQRLRARTAEFVSTRAAS